MGDGKGFVFCWIFLTLFLTATVSECWEERKNPKKKNPVGEKETNVFNFFRLILLRTIYGLATMLGFQEGISDFLGGILVPPGADDYGDYKDYYGGGGGDGDYGEYDFDY